jgi:phosphoglycolate phosphatase-like HAD superfamily hydrolase
VAAPFEPQRVKAILFDLDGTLADTDDLLVDRLTLRLSRWAFLLPGKNPSAAARRLMMNAENPFNSLYAWADRLYLDEAWAFASRLLPGRRGPRPPVMAAPVPGVVRAVRKLALHYGVGVVTTRSSRAADDILRAIGLADAFGVVANARSTLRIKPHPAPVLWAARQFELPPAACVMVGDTTVDIRAGLAAGTQVVGVLCGFGDRHELARAGAQAIIDSPADLPDLLSKP